MGTREGKVLALDAGNGSLIWEFDPGEGLELGSVFGTPAVGEQHIYVGGDSGDREGKDGRLYALRKDRQSGNDIRRTEGEWVRPPTEGEIGAIVGGPALAEGLVLVGSNDGNLYAYHATGRSSGEEAWRFSTDGQIWSTPVVADGIVYFGSMDRHVYAVYATGDRAGETAWKYRTGGAVLTKPLLFEGMVIAGSFDTKLYALDSRTGLPRWSFEGDDWFWAGAVSDGDHIFASSMAGTVYALDRDGIPLWPLPFKAGSPIISTPVVVGDALVVGTDEGKLHLLSTRNGKETAQVKVLGGPVKAALSRFENMVYVGDEDDMVRGVDAKGWVVQWRYP